MKRSTVRLLLLLVLLVFVVPIAAFAAEDNETPPEGNNSTPAAVETPPAPASAPAPASGTGSTEGPAPSQQPAATNEPTPGETPATTDGTTPEDKSDAAEEDEENPEPAAEKADVEKAKLASVKKNGAMLGTLQAEPGKIYDQVTLEPGKPVSGVFTIEGAGVVLGPTSGTATISEATITNKANNSRNGGVTGSDCRGSALIAQSNGILKFEGVTIDSTENKGSIVLNIWQNGRIDANGLTLNGPNNSLVDTVFMLVGNYNGTGKGTLNFTGTNENMFDGVTGTIAGAKDGTPSEINISGTLTVTNSTIKMAQNIAFIVKKDATLTLQNSTLYNSKVVVESGGKLIVKNSTLDTKETKDPEAIFNDHYINVKSGGMLEMKDKSAVKNHSGSFVAILAEDNATVDLTNCEFLNNSHPNLPGGAIRGINADITVNGCQFKNNTAKWGGAIHMSGGMLKIDDNLPDNAEKSTFTGNLATGYQDKEESATAGGAIMLTGVNAKIGASTFQENGIPEDGVQNHFTMRGGAIHIDTGSTVVLNGTKFLNNGVDYPAGSYDDSPTSTGGAICIEGKNAFLDIKGAQFKNNYSGTTGGALSLLRGSQVTIGALNALNKYTPTMFEGNRVNYGYDFSGGAIFIHDGARLDMENAAIYDNTADGAGGGIATCWTGSAQVHLLDGAVIYDNKVKIDGNRIEGIDKDVQDIYFLEVVARKNEKTEELSEQMFNGGLHRWKIKRITGSRNYVNGHQKTNAMVAGSNPTSNKTTKAQVIFTKNSVTAHNHDENGYIAYGGAIACNGKLYIGTDKPSEKELTEIKIVKIWDDKDDTSKRPTDPDTLKSKIHLRNGNTDLGSLAAIETAGDVSVTVLTGVDAKAVNPYSDAVYGDKKEPEKNDIYDLKTGKWKLVNDTYWVIIVSGLEKLADAKSYKVTEDEDAVPSYHTKDINGLVITNTLNDVPPTPTGGGGSPSTIKVAVEKKWDDQNDQDKTRPDSVTVRLLADGVDTGKTVKLSASNNWKASFTNLAEKKSGKVITYTVEEETVAGYTASVTGDRKAGFVIENKLTPPETPTPPDEPTPPTPPDEPTPPDTPPDTPTTPDEPTTPDTPTTPDKPTGETEDYGPSDNPSRTIPNGKTPTTGTPPTTGRTPTTGTTSSNGSVTPRTGDESHTALWAALALMSLGGICAVVVNPRKQKR